MSEIPDIEATEPVVEGPDDESVLVTCTLEWRETLGNFVNVDSKEDWEPDEYSFQEDSKYEVKGEMFDTLDEAIEEALKGTDFNRDDVSVFHHYRL